MIHDKKLTDAICSLTCVLRTMNEQLVNENTKVLKRIEQKVDNLMSAISDFAAKQNAFNDRQSAAIDAAVASVTTLTEDVATLNDKITELQNSSGGVTPEDQTLINTLETQGEALATKAESVAAALKALDDLTPPKAPIA